MQYQSNASHQTPHHAPSHIFSTAELQRYSRHLLLSDVGLAGQQTLAVSSVLIVGAGGLGSPAALYLAAAGIGRLGLVDFDDVDESNLQRQILHSSDDVGTPKIESARKRLSALNPHTRLELHSTRLNNSNALEILREYDIVIDGTDNFATRYLLNDACSLLGKPLVYGAVYKFEGQVAVFHPHRADVHGSCYRCLFPTPPPAELAPNCAEIGVLGVIPGVIGTLQATEALKLLLGLGEPLIGRMLLVDTLSMSFSTIPIPKHKQCRACEGCSFVNELIEYEAFCATPVLATSKSQNESQTDTISPTELARKASTVILLDIREAWERALGFIEGSVHIPLSDIEQFASEEQILRHDAKSNPNSPIRALPKEAAIVVYCASGIRSKRALEILQMQGFANARHLVGGFAAWKAAFHVAEHLSEKTFAEIREKP